MTQTRPQVMMKLMPNATDGPTLLFSVDDNTMGDTVQTTSGASLHVHVQTASPRG